MPSQHIEKPANPTRLLMLGASGFLASDLARRLTQECLDFRAVGSAEVDLTRPESVTRLQELLRADDSLVIMSALTPEKGKDPATFTKNILMIAHVCAALERQDCRHVLYLSSDAVYPDSDTPMTEESLVSPKGLYATMHLAREQMLEVTTAKAQIPLCLVRPCAVYGAGDTHNSYGPNRFIRSALANGRIELFGEGEEERDHVCVRDVSEFLLLCLRHRAQGIFNITSGSAISFLELAQRIERLSPRPVAVEKRLRSVPITHRRFDGSLRRKLFPQFNTVPLEIGLREMIEEVASRASKSKDRSV
jgi:nucleoside-diphosphate-sugar epimerase